MAFCIVVDGYNGSRQIVSQVKKRGFHCIHIKSSASELNTLNLNNLSEYDASLIYDNDINKLLTDISTVVGEQPILCVLPGIDIGVPLADLLSEKLNLSSNGTSLSATRHNKFLMRKALNQANLAVPLYMKSASLALIKEWVHSNTSFPVVMKPIKSAGTDNVFICENDTELEFAFNKIIGNRNILGFNNCEVIVESYLRGPEYIINSVSCNGKHVLNDIWVYRNYLADFSHSLPLSVCCTFILNISKYILWEIYFISLLLSL